MTLYSCAVGTSWVLIEAHNADNAREQLGVRLGYEHKPWLWRGIAVRRATAEDVRTYGAVADSARKPSTSNTPKPGTVETLSKLVSPDPDLVGEP